MKIITWLNTNYRAYISLAWIVYFVSMRIFSPDLGESVWISFCCNFFLVENMWYEIRKKVKHLDDKTALWYRISAIAEAVVLLYGLIVWVIVTPETEDLLFTILYSLCLLMFVVMLIVQYKINKNA